MTDTGADIQRIDREQVLQFRQLDSRIKRLQVIVGVLGVVAIGSGIANYMLAMHRMPNELKLESGSRRMALDPSGMRVYDGKKSITISTSSISMGDSDSHDSVSLSPAALRLDNDDANVWLDANKANAGLHAHLPGPGERGFTLETSAALGGSLWLRGGNDNGQVRLDTKSELGVGLQLMLPGQKPFYLPPRDFPKPSTDPMPPLPKTPDPKAPAPQK